jgi:peptide/nickel transport system substrate-binding protein
LLTKLNFKFQLFFSYFKKNWILVSLVILLGIAAFFFRNQLITLYNLPIWHPKIIGQEGLYTVSNLPDEINSQISFGLITYSENQKPIISPLVKSLDIQNNNKEYIFTLNNNLYWSNGKKFTAYDVNYQIPGTTITPLSNYQIKISLETEFSPILSLLSKPLFKKNLVGLGPYQVTQITYQEGYVKTLSLKPKDQNKNSLQYRFYTSEQEVIDAYKIGNVDEIKINSLPSEFNTWNKTKINQSVETNNKYVAVFLNNQKITSKQIRQALAYATPKSKDKNERCLGPISPQSWAYNPNIKDYNLNSIRAKELLGTEKVDKLNLTINDRRLLPIAENIKNSWKSILGIDVAITIENQIDLNNFDAILTYGAITKDPDQYLFWHSTQTNTNITKLNNSRIDKLLEEGRQTNNQTERKTVYQDFQRFLLEESPAIFISYPTIYTISRSSN